MEPPDTVQMPGGTGAERAQARILGDIQAPKVGNPEILILL